MKRFDPGDTVRIDIPDETDPDHELLHGKRGMVIKVLSDDAGAVTGDEREGYLSGLKLLMVTPSMSAGEIFGQSDWFARSMVDTSPV